MDDGKKDGKTRKDDDSSWEERDDGGSEGRSLGEDVDDMSSWVAGGVESTEAEQEYWEQWEQEKPQREGKQWDRRDFS